MYTGVLQLQHIDYISKFYFQMRTVSRSAGDLHTQADELDGQRRSFQGSSGPLRGSPAQRKSNSSFSPKRNFPVCLKFHSK